MKRLAIMVLTLGLGACSKNKESGAGSQPGGSADSHEGHAHAPGKHEEEESTGAGHEGHGHGPGKHAQEHGRTLALGDVQLAEYRFALSAAGPVKAGENVLEAEVTGGASPR